MLEKIKCPERDSNPRHPDLMRAPFVRSGCRGFESRSGHLIFSSNCSVYIERHKRGDLSDDEHYENACQCSCLKEAYPGFCSMSDQSVFLLLPRWDARPSQSYPPPSPKFAGTHAFIHLCGGRHCESNKKCFGQEHDTVADDSQELNSKGFIQIFSSRMTAFTAFHKPELKNLPVSQLVYLSSEIQSPIR